LIRGGGCTTGNPTQKREIRSQRRKREKKQADEGKKGVIEGDANLRPNPGPKRHQRERAIGIGEYRKGSILGRWRGGAKAPRVNLRVKKKAGRKKKKGKCFAEKQGCGGKTGARRRAWEHEKGGGGHKRVGEDIPRPHECGKATPKIQPRRRKQARKKEQHTVPWGRKTGGKGGNQVLEPSNMPNLNRSTKKRAREAMVMSK